jgi:cytochrome c oxidase subunit 4
MSRPPFTRDDRRILLRHMRMPLLSFVSLLLLLGVSVTLGATQPFPGAWLGVCAVTLAMVVIVLLVSMEVVREPPLIRLFSVLGFFWVGILFAMTLVDYLSR